MNQQPDKLFKDALENHQRQAPVIAWSRIESGLNKKKSKPGWLSIAASLLFILTLTATIWWFVRQEAPSSKKIITQNQITPDPVKESEQQKEILPQNSSVPPALAEHSKAQILSSAETSTQVSVPKEKQVTQEKPMEEVPGSGIPEQVEINEPSELISITAVNDTVEQYIEEVSRKDNYKIVLEASEVNEKYLNKKSLAQATDDSKKTSTLKKVLDKAYDLKHDQDPFGELRQMKNEILALNLQGDRKQQNK